MSIPLKQIAAELDRTAADLETLGLAIVSLPGLECAAITCLQQFDAIAQRQRELARLMRGDAGVKDLGLDCLRERLAATA